MAVVPQVEWEKQAHVSNLLRQNAEHQNNAELSAFVQKYFATAPKATQQVETIANPPTSTVANSSMAPVDVGAMAPLAKKTRTRERSTDRGGWGEEPLEDANVAATLFRLAAPQDKEPTH